MAKNFSLAIFIVILPEESLILLKIFKKTKQSVNRSVDKW